MKLNSRIQILPDILESRVEAFKKKVDVVMGKARRIHVDVMEQKTVNNETILPRDWPKIDKGLEVDAHLMVQEPMEWIEESIESGATMVCGHVERLDNFQSFVDRVVKTRAKAGLVIDLPTKVSILGLEKLKNLTQIMIMSVKIGLSGQVFDKGALEKIRWVRENCSNCAEIAVDGGINDATAQQCIENGATVLAVNSYLWKNFPTNLHKLQNFK